MQGERVLTADLELNDEWDIEGSDREDEFRDAVETVRDNHDSEVFVEAESLYHLKVRWNDSTDEVRFDVLAAAGTYVVEEDEGGDA